MESQLLTTTREKAESTTTTISMMQKNCSINFTSTPRKWATRQAKIFQWARRSPTSWPIKLAKKMKQLDIICSIFSISIAASKGTT
jgi:hypothetical protein